MSDKLYKNFLIRNTVAGTVSLLIVFIFSKWQKEFFETWFFILPFYSFILNILVLKSIQKTIKRSNLQLIVTTLFGTKFFGYLVPIIVALILKPQKEILLVFVLLVFILYVLFTVVITKSVLQYFNSASISSDNSK